MISEWVFLLSVGALIWVYLGFFLLTLLIAKFVGRRPMHNGKFQPTVTIIVCGYNEEKHILRKYQNCLELEYPKEKVEIILVSDGSTDTTADILTPLSGNATKVLINAERQGKTACQNLALEHAKNEIIFFTDATTLHPPDALRMLVRNLEDPQVGCVTGKPIFKRDEGVTSAGLGKRESYEILFRRKLGEIYTLFGATDCIYVIPRRLYSPIRKDLDSGFVGPLKVLEKGFRTVYEGEAIAYVDRPAPKLQDEFIRRSRIVLRGMRGLLHMKQLMNPLRYGFVALALISSRFLRWLTPIFLLLAFISNIFLIGETTYLVTLLFQIAFYGTGLVTLLIEKGGGKVKGVFSIPLYFCLISSSALVGITRLLLGDTGQMWQTRR